MKNKCEPYKTYYIKLNIIYASRSLTKKHDFTIPNDEMFVQISKSPLFQLSD